MGAKENKENVEKVEKDQNAALIKEMEEKLKALEAENAAFKAEKEKEEKAAAEREEAESQIPYGEQEVEILLQQPSGHKEPFHYVKINQRSWQIPYDQPTKVPRCVMEALKNSAVVRRQSKRRDSVGVIEVQDSSVRL